MIRRTILIGAALVGVFVLVLGTLYFMGGKHAGQGGGFFERIAGGMSAVTGQQTPEEMASYPEFAFHRLEIDTSQSQPQACLVFTRDLDISGHTHYEDYISIDPQTRIVARPLDARLCIAGLSFNATYTLTLKKGFPDKAREKLTEEETVPVQVSDKPSLVRFSGGIILPRDNAQGVPVTTVNIDRLKLKIIRVGDRLLSQIESGTVDQTTLYSYDEQQLEDNQGSIVWKGTMDVANVKNDSVVTLIPIRDILKGKPPGAYVLVAEDNAKAKASDDSSDDGNSDELATQWIIDSD